MIKINREEVESVKLSIRGIEYQGISAIKTLTRSIHLQYEYYGDTGNDAYLYSALSRIQAYLELGFVYDSEQELFDRILFLLGTSREELFPKRTYAAKEIVLTKPQIRRLIKPWSCSIHHTMPIDKVPDDIMDKVLNKRIGRYEYHSNAHPLGTDFDYVYILFVDQDDSYIYNVQKGIYYRLIPVV